MPVRNLAAMPLILLLLIALSACSSPERRRDLFGSDSDGIEYGVAPTGPIGTTTIAPATLPRTPVTAPSPATVTVPETSPAAAVRNTVPEGFTPYPVYPAPAPRWWDSHEDAPPEEPMDEVVDTEEMAEEPVTPIEVYEEPRRVGDMTVDELRAALGTGPRYQARRVGCDSCGDNCNPCGHDSFVGGFIGAFPGLGFGVEWLREFRQTQNFSMLWDVSLTYQDLSAFFDDEEQSGKYNALRLGVALRGSPRGRIHPTVRGGITWFRVSGNPEVIDVASFDEGGDYIGVYLAVGVDFDITDCVTTGPEVGYVAGIEAGNGEFGGTLEARWHILFKF